MQLFHIFFIHSFAIQLQHHIVSSLLSKGTYNRLATSMATQFVSAEFEVFGQVQGCYFTKYLKEQCDVLDIGGWVKNTKKGTVFGIIQGTKQNVEMMVMWLSNTGSPGSKIERCEMKNWSNLARPEFKGFSVRF